MDIASIITESKLANNIVKSLSRGYKLTTDKDQLKFLFLSVYLLALGKKCESENISRFISSNCKYDGNENTWNSVGHQTLLLARHQRLKGNIEESQRLTKIIEHEDILTARLTKSEYLKELLEEFDEELEFLLTETPKWRCEGLVFLYIHFNYCREFAELKQYGLIDEVAKKTEPKMNQILKLISENLT